MPKSKRNKIVHLTQVKKKTKDHKEDLMKQVEQLASRNKRVFLIDFEGVKSDRIMHLRVALKPHGSIFAGKNTIVTSVLKRMGSKSKTDYEGLLKHVKGHRGLLFTNIHRTKLIDKITSDHPEFEGKLLGFAQLTAEPESEEEVEGAKATTPVKTVITASGLKIKRTNKRKKSGAEMREVKYVEL